LSASIGFVIETLGFFCAALGSESTPALGRLSPQEPNRKGENLVMRLKSLLVAASLGVASLVMAGAASAQPRVEVIIPAAPAARVEVIPVRPSPEHVWMRGYWNWNHPERRYVWVPGYWMHQHVVIAPPAIRVENPGPPPSARHFWARGHWMYNGARYEWIGGHWDTVRPGFEWVHAHYDFYGGRYHFVEGQWRQIR
jgi:hypothetical protein